MAPKPKSSVIQFRPFARPAGPAAALPLPEGAMAPAVVDLPPALDLSGKRKAWFFIGRGRIGKTSLARWVAEIMDNRGGTAIIAAADPMNRSLRVFLDNVAEPPSTDPEDVKDWLKELLQYAMEQKVNALIDLGGGNTSLSALLREMPDLAEVLAEGGLEPVAVHVLGPDPHDLVPLAVAEGEGFKPRATAVVLNEVHARRHRFDEVQQHPAFRAVMERGGVRLWMPMLTPDAARQCDTNAWRYLDVKGRAGPFAASAVQTWLRRMSEEFQPISTWLPDA